MAIRMSPDVVEAARALGCTAAEVEQNARGKVRVHCSCGYTSTYRLTRADALQALVHHLQTRTRAARRDGVSLRQVAG